MRPGWIGSEKLYQWREELDEALDYPDDHEHVEVILGRLSEEIHQAYLDALLEERKSERSDPEPRAVFFCSCCMEDVAGTAREHLAHFEACKARPRTIADQIALVSKLTEVISKLTEETKKGQAR